MINSPHEGRPPLGRRLILGILTALAGRGQRPPLAARDLRRVLLIRHDRLGDAVITTPLIDALRTAAPQVEIDVLASPANAGFFADDPRITNVLLWRRSLWGRIRAIRFGRARRYDAVFQLILGRTTLPALLAALIARSGRTIGKLVIAHERLYDHSVETNGGHFSRRTFALIGGVALDAPMEQPPYRMIVSEEARSRAEQLLVAGGLGGSRIAVLNISSGTRDRELHREQNVALARSLAGDDLRVVVIGAPAAAGERTAIAEQSGAVGIPTQSVQIAAAVLARAQVVITPDTSIVHIASAVGAPTVALFPADGNPAGWGPYGVPYHVIQTKAHGDRASVDVEEVLAAARDLLGR